MKPLTLSDRLVVPEAVVSRELDGEMVLLNLDTGVYFGLDAVATDMWRAIQGAGPLGDAMRAVEAQYDIDPDTLVEDLLRLAGQLVAKGLLQLDSPEPSRP